MPAPVSVEIAPPEPREDLRKALLDACTRTLQDTACVENTGESEPSSAVAIVSWRDRENVRLEVAIRANPEWMMRDIHFAAEDAPEERWRTVGLVIGTLTSVMKQRVANATKKPPTPASAPAPESPPVSVEPPPPAPSPPSLRGWVDLGAVLGPALDTGPLRLGVEGAGHLRIAGPVYATLGVVYAEGLGRVQGVRTQFLGAFAGAAVDIALGSHFALVPRAELFVEQLEPSLATGSRAPTSGDRTLGGGRLGADVCYRGLAPFGFFVGAMGTVTAGVTDVRVEERVVGTAQALGGLVRAGVAVGFR